LPDESTVYGFQFLIGTIKTETGIDESELMKNQFQFLIGTIKTGTGSAE